MATKPSPWSRFGKYVSAVVIVCFFLPFFGVSCDGMDIITISGADMVGGCKPGGLIAAADEKQKERGAEPAMRGGSLDVKLDKVEVEPFAIAALALVVFLFAISFKRTRQATIGALILAALTFALLVALYVKTARAMGDAVDKETKSAAAGGIRKDIKIDAGGRMGLWGAELGLLAVMYLTVTALRRRDDPS